MAQRPLILFPRLGADPPKADLFDAQRAEGQVVDTSAQVNSLLRSSCAVDFPSS